MKKDRKKPLRFCHIQLKNWKNFARADIAVQNRIFWSGQCLGEIQLLGCLPFSEGFGFPGEGFQESIGRRGGLTKIRPWRHDAPRMWKYWLS